MAQRLIQQHDQGGPRLDYRPDQRYAANGHQWPVHASSAVERETGRGPCTGRSAPSLVAVLDGLHHGADLLASGAETLHEMQQDQQDRRPRLQHA
ncbi:hypothetical protein [Nocardia sp. CA-290969]|uniref:hypothetical protein n=1 Tax=Nocardia sp. CA-290969 TaxID=3239986 RepID=UPI003D933F8F